MKRLEIGMLHVEIFDHIEDADTVDPRKDGRTTVRLVERRDDGVYMYLLADPVRLGDGGAPHPIPAGANLVTTAVVDVLDMRDTPEADQAADPMMQFFQHKHLPPHLQAISKPFGELAERLLALPRNPERTVALRKLLEAKDCAVRANIYK